MWEDGKQSIKRVLSQKNQIPLISKICCSPWRTSWEVFQLSAHTPEIFGGTEKSEGLVTTAPRCWSLAALDPSPSLLCPQTSPCPSSLYSSQSHFLTTFLIFPGRFWPFPTLIELKASLSYDNCLIGLRIFFIDPYSPLDHELLDRWDCVLFILVSLNP